MLLLLVACTPEDSASPAVTDTVETGVPYTTHPSDTFAVKTISPTAGPELGGTLVRITGLGFTSETAVTVGGVDCASLVYASPTELFCTTAAAAPGAVTLEVVEGAASGTATFTYLAATWDSTPVDTDATAEVERCTLLDPLLIETDTNGDSVELYAEVVVPGRTDLIGEPVGVDMQVGMGPTGTDPDTWAWEDVYWEEDGDGADVFQDYWYPDDDGIFEYSFRAQVDHGPYTICTAENGAYGRAIVTPPPEIPIDYCHLQWPCSTTTLADEESEDIYAWIYQPGVTDSAGEGEGLWVDIGIGPMGTDPETSSEWWWYSMDYSEDKDGLLEGDLANDEYVGTMWVPDEVGTYVYVARATADEGVTWTICDIGGDTCGGGGSSDGYDESTAGICTVE